MIAPERFASRRDTLAFVLCIVLSLAARVSPPQVQQTVAIGVSNSVLAPLLAIQRQAVLMREARAGVALVSARRDSAVVDSLQVFMLREENARIRDLLALSGRTPLSHVAAEVLHQSSPMDEFTFVLSAGRDQGVVEMAPVIAPGGLVGVVRSVGPRSSVAALWTHPDFRVSAMTAEGTVFGIAEPRGSVGPHTALMEIRGIPFRDDVPEGSMVYTSGRGSSLGGAFPRGIPIGTVQTLAEQNVGWSKTYVVRPAVQPGSVSHVVILLGGGDDVSAAFGIEEP